MYKGIPRSVIENRGGEGVTGKLGRGSHSIVDNNSSNRAAMSAHEVLGHGRSLSLGRTKLEQQHVDAIQLKNLVHRVTGSPIVRDGHDHGPNTIITNSSDIPTQLINKK